jgi:hypothetical protein
MKWIYLAGVAAALASGPASAVFISGQNLHDQLVRYNASRLDFDSIYAAGYVTGVADAFDQVAYCMPIEVTRGQVFQIATNYLNAHPEHWQSDASALLLEAFKTVWPCKTK